MDISTLHGQLRAGQLDSFYIFTGVEWAVQKMYIKQISKIAKKEAVYIDSIADIYGKLNNNSFIKKSYVYIVRDDKELMNSEKLQAQIKTVLGDNVLVLLITTLDKRTKFYKAYKDTIVEFEPLKPEILKKYIQREITLTSHNIDRLMEVCEYDYGRCLPEINKIKMYAGSPEADIDLCFEGLLKNGTIYTPPKDAIFDFVDAVIDAKRSAFKLYQNCLDVGEAVMVMISVLYNNAKAVLQVQSCKSNDIAKSTGLTPWQVQGASRHAGKRTNRGLIEIMQICQECQQGIVTGNLDEEYAMDYILASVL